MTIRDDFENHFSGVYGMAKDSLNQYVAADTAAAWDGWQVARTQGGEAVISKDAYDGAREDLQIWKKRALEAEKLLQEEIESNARLVEVCNDLQGPTHMGEPAISSRQPAHEARPIAYTNGSQLFYLWDEEGEGKMFAERESSDDIALYTTPQPGKWISVSEDCARMSLEALEKFTRDIRNGATGDPEPVEHHYGMRAIDELMSALPTPPEQESE